MPGRGRLADRSLVLTVATLILLSPPIVTIFNVPRLVFGVPLLHVYCFGVWLAAILAGARLAARLGSEEMREPPPPEPPER
jgi:hypothetical protein